MPTMVFPQYKRGRNGIETFAGTILDHARKLGIEISSECGGRGQCRRCIVRVDRGAEALGPKTPAELEANLADDERLACQAHAVGPGDIRVFVKVAAPYTILTTSQRQEVELAPSVYRKDDSVVHKVPAGEQVLDRHRGGIYGLAIDVGTTTLVFEIVDLESGDTLATLAQRNPQAAYGDDVISRIGHTREHEGGLPELQRVVVNAINDAVAEWEQHHEPVADRVYDVVVVGNPTMRDITFGVDVSSLGVLPFQPQSTDPVERRASDLGLGINAAAHVYGGPLIGGHAGADAVADVLASGMHTRAQPSMLVDIGTNGEVIVGNSDTMLAASCAAGGAYEGAVVSCGVGALEGAIKNITIRDGQVSYETIGDKPAIGLCGSGLIDLLAELLRTGIMTRAGKLTMPNKEFPVDAAAGLTLTQEDVHNLMVARAGMSLDQKALTEQLRLTTAQLEHLYLAGAFGNYVNSESATRIGLLPDAGDRVVKLGNAALEGARLMLLSEAKKREAEGIARGTQYIRPNEDEQFFDALVARMCFESWQ